MTNEQLLILLLGLQNHLDLAIVNYKTDNPEEGREIVQTTGMRGFDALQKLNGTDTVTVFDKLAEFENILSELDLYVDTLKATSEPLVKLVQG